MISKGDGTRGVEIFAMLPQSRSSMLTIETEFDSELFLCAGVVQVATLLGGLSPTEKRSGRKIEVLYRERK